MLIRLAVVAGIAGLSLRAPEPARYKVDQRIESRVDLSAFGQGEHVIDKHVGGLTDEALAALSSHAKTLGYTDAEWEMIQLDPRAAVLIYKAMKNDQLQANKATAVTKAATPVVKPGASNPMPQQVKDKLGFMKAMKSAKTSTDKAKLIEQEMMRRF